MTAKIISVANMKGGVGKTTVSVALAHAFAKGPKHQSKVLVVDLDAQANASFWLCGHAGLTSHIDQGKTIDTFLEDSIVFSRTVALTDSVHRARTSGFTDSLFVIPSSPNLRLIERELIVFLSRRQRNLLEVERVVSELFEQQMKDLCGAYDVIIFDTAPGISALTEAALRSSHVVIVPTVPDFISNLGLLSFCRTVRWSDDASKRTPWVVANKVKKSGHHQLMLKQMRAEAEGPDREFAMFQTEIPHAAWIEETASDLDGDNAEAFVAKGKEEFSALATEVLAVAEQGRASISTGENKGRSPQGAPL